MAKHKYRFNPEKLVFEKFRNTTKDWLLRILGVLSTFLISFFIIYLLIFKYLDSPKDKELKRELRNYELNYKILSNRIENLESVIDDLESRDKNIYRTIFEAEPIPGSIRNAGYGGIEKYKELEGYRNSELIIETTQRVDKMSKKLYILSKSYDEISKLAGGRDAMIASIPAIQPVSNKGLSRIASGFGYRIDPFYRVPRMHTGLDFAAPRGTPVFATGDGVVTTASSSYGGYGNQIVINHGYGYQTLYAHLSGFAVRAGTKVKRGDKIGYIGSTGKSTAPHLHYEVIKNGYKVNPVFFFYNDLTPAEYEKMLKLAEQAHQSLD